MDRIAAASSRLVMNRSYFIADLLLPTANERMQQIADGAMASGYERLASVLFGGAFRYLDCEPVHGVADWTTSYHIRGTVDDATAEATRHAGQGVDADADSDVSMVDVATNSQSSTTLHEDNGHPHVSPYPIYFHCETHRAGAVNFRMEDAHVAIDGTSAKASTLVTPLSHPAYWICVLPEADNMRLFHSQMEKMVLQKQTDASTRFPAAAASSGASIQYSVDDMQIPSISSIEPLLRAGVVFTLLEQRESELVVLQPGTPNIVFTPSHACKTSRNWITPKPSVGRRK